MSLGIGKMLAAVPALLAFGGAWAAVELWERWNCYRRARRERAQLLAMGERDLHDLGLSRVDAVRYAEAPVWRDCSGLRRAVP